MKCKMKLEKETKNSVRYKEQAEEFPDGTSIEPPLIGTIYIKKYSLRKEFGNIFPDEIEVEVTKK